MKNITSAKELGNRIAEKLGLSFEVETYEELAEFVEEVTPAIDEEFIGGKTSFEDFWRRFEDDSPLPYWQIVTDKKTLADIMREFQKQNLFGEVSYWSQELDMDSEDLDEMPEDGMIVADIEPNSDTAEFIEKLRVFSEANDAALYFKLYNLYPFYEHFTKLLGNNANEIVWHIENGKILTDGQEIVVIDGAEGDLFLVQCWWLSGFELEMLEKYGLRVALEITDEAPKSWKMLDCGMSIGLRIKYGK